MKDFIFTLIGFLWGVFLLVVFCYQGEKIENLNAEVYLLKSELYKNENEYKKLIKDQEEKTERLFDSCIDGMRFLLES